MTNFVGGWNRADRDREISVFSPFEVQILDVEASRAVESGDASHGKYKKAQIRTARKRILATVLSM